MNKSGRKSNNKSNKRPKAKRVTVAVFLGVIGIAAVACTGILVKRFTPETQMMSGYDYFNVQESPDKVMVILDGQQYKDEGINVDGELYLPQEFVADNINIRFYYDKESHAVLYTDSKAIYTFHPDIKGYSDSLGNTVQTEQEIAKNINGTCYLNFKYIVQYTNCAYEYSSDPARVVITTTHEEQTCVTATKNTVIRYRAGIKSKVLEEVTKDDKLYYKGKVDDWTQVMTSSGYTGYIKTASVSATFTEVPADTFIDNYQCISKNHKINMAWFQTTSASSNSYIGNYLANTSGLNTISPTWYSVTSAQGDFSSIASADFVQGMHARGLEVWPLVNDFDKTVDYKALYSSKTARTKMISTLIHDAKSYGYDGINLDFENIKTEDVQDYLQFMRELSVACQTANIVLSADNYKPQSYNAYYNLKEQSSFADYIIIMGYDEHYAGSDAGSVASLPFVESGIADASAMVPSTQLINAIPFYTRIWTISASGTTSKAVGMQGAVDEMNANGATATWDAVEGQNYSAYQKDGAQVEIWLEDEKSIEQKMNVISKYQLAGVAEWKLGFETPAIWNVISRGLNY